MSGKRQEEIAKQPQAKQQPQNATGKLKVDDSKEEEQQVRPFPSHATMPAKTQQHQPSLFASGDSVATADLLQEAGLSKETFKSSDSTVSTFDSTFLSGLAQTDPNLFATLMMKSRDAASHPSDSGDAAFNSRDYLANLLKSKDGMNSEDSDALLASVMKSMQSASTGGQLKRASRSASEGLKDADPAMFNSQDWFMGSLSQQSLDVDPNAVFKSEIAPSAQDTAQRAVASKPNAMETLFAGYLSKIPAASNVKPPAAVAAPSRKRKARDAQDDDENDEEWVPADETPVTKKKAAPSPKKKTGKKSTSKKRARKRPNYEPKVKVYYDITDKDVLLGRGGRTNHHIGNKKYLAEKEIIQPRYLAATKEDKTGISQELVDVVHAWGGRFLVLEAESGKWYEAAPIHARKKASQTLRENNTPEERAAKRQRYKK